MDLRHPLRSLVPSLDWAVLEVLVATHSSLGASQIARLAARGTRAGHAPILDRLVAHGIVDAEPGNQGFLYRLNRDHMLAPVIVTAAGVRAELLRRLSSAVEALDPRPIHASLFGSFARGDAGEDSDIDLLLVTAHPDGLDAWDAQIERLAGDVHRWTGNRAQILAFDAERVRQLGRQEEPIVSDWVADGLVLTGEPIDRLLGSLPKLKPVAQARARR